MTDAWYVAIAGQRQGPLSTSQLRQLAASGRLGPADMLWKEGMPQWVRCDSIKGLLPPSPPPVGSGAGRSTPVLPPPGGARPPRPVAPPPRTDGLAAIPAGQTPALSGASMPGEMVGGYPPPAVSDSKPIGEPVMPGGPLPGQYAEFMPRVGAVFLDGLFLGLVVGIPLLLLVVGLAVSMSAAGMSPDSPLLIVFQFFVQAIAFVVVAAYFILLESSQKQGTWGKQIMGIRVTDLEGRRVTIGRATGRFFAKYFLSNCTCGIAFLMPLFTEKKQTLHDMISGCLALKK